MSKIQDLKKKIESAVIASLIKELTFLNLDKVFNVELTKFNSEKNKISMFQLSIMEREIDDLNAELKNLFTHKEDIENAINSSTIPSEEINLTRDRIKGFLTRIYSPTPDIQNMLLKQFVESINYNLINDTISVHIIIKSTSDENILLDKTLYTSF
jgi:hypothetical protein